MSEEPKLAMDAMEETAPPVQEQAPEQPSPDAQTQSDRPRDEGGRFAPKQEGQPRGKPDAEARDRRLAQERDEARAEAERLRKRFEDVTSLISEKPQEQTAEIPAELKPLLQKIEGIDQRLSARDQQEQDAQAWNQVRTIADQDEARFREQQPDFPNAVQHYIQSRINEMSAFGLSQDQAEAQLAQEAQALLVQCTQQGRSPAATMYAMAQARGYQTGAMPQVQPQGGPQPQRPAGGRSLGTGGGPAGGGVTAAQIAAMTDDEYNQFRSTPEGRAAIKRAMGGV